MTTAASEMAVEENQGGDLETMSASSSPSSSLEAYSARSIEAIAVLQEGEGCRYRVVEANGRFQRWVGTLDRLEKLDFVECLVKTEDQARFKIAIAKVREGGSDSIDDETLDTVVRGCDTLLLGKLTDVPTYKRFDWAISLASKNGSVILSGRRLSQVSKHEQEAESEFMDFFHKAPIALHWLSSTGHVLWANDRELEVLGYTAEEYIGQPIMNFCPDSEEDVLEIFKELGTGNTIRDVPVRFRTKSGEIRDLLIDSNVSYNTDGSFKHTRCFIRDDSARKVKEARYATARRFLEQQAEEKEVFTRLIFHEILTPCHISLQSLQFAMGDSPADAAGALDKNVESAISDAQMQMQMMVEIINDAEDASRFEQGGNSHAGFFRGLPRHGHRRQGLPPPHPQIIAEKQRQATVTTAGSIEVGVSHAYGGESPPSDAGSTATRTQQQQQQQQQKPDTVNLTFSVKDTGPGIETTRVNALFQKYWQHTFDLGLKEQEDKKTARPAAAGGPPSALPPSSAPNDQPTSPPTVPPSPSYYDHPMSESDSPSPTGSAGGVSGSRGRAPWVVEGDASSAAAAAVAVAAPAGSLNVLARSHDVDVVDGGSCSTRGGAAAAGLGDSGRLAGSSTGGEGASTIGKEKEEEKEEECSSSVKISKRFELASSGGIGLGLNVAYNLVQGMGGTLHCSEKMMVEARKTLGADKAAGAVKQSWPHVLESEAAKRIVDIPPGLKPNLLSDKAKCVGLKNTIHVLVVDDNTICQKVLCRTLANLNCTTEVAANGQQAADKMAAHQVSIYSLVLMDLRMPIMDGLSATRVIRHKLGIKHIPIVAISAERSDELCKECFSAGMDDFIQKPASKDGIQETLQKLGVLPSDGSDTP